MQPPSFRGTRYRRGAAKVPLVFRRRQTAQRPSGHCKRWLLEYSVLAGVSKHGVKRGVIWRPIIGYDS